MLPPRPVGQEGLRNAAPTIEFRPMERSVADSVGLVRIGPSLEKDPDDIRITLYDRPAQRRGFLDVDPVRIGPVIQKVPSDFRKTVLYGALKRKGPADVGAVRVGAASEHLVDGSLLALRDGRVQLVVPVASAQHPKAQNQPCPACEKFPHHGRSLWKNGPPPQKSGPVLSGDLFRGISPEGLCRLRSPGRR